MPSRKTPRRRLVSRAAGLVSATTVLTLLVLLASERSLSAPKGPDARGRAAGPQYAGAASPSVPASGPTATSSVSSAGPRAAVPVRPSGTSASVDGNRTGPRASATARRPAAAALPFTWHVDGHVWRGGCEHAYLVDSAPRAVPPPPSESDAEPWARALGAVHGGETLVRVTVQGRGEQTVVLQALRVRVAAKRSPEPANLYRMGMSCGGTLSPRSFDVDLDAARPVARPVPGDDSGTEIPAVSFPYRTSVRDPEVLLVTGRTVTCDCDWYLELEWSSGDRSGTVRIDDDGRPFRTSGVRNAPVHLYDSGARSWFRAEPSEEVPQGGGAPGPRPPTEEPVGPPAEPRGLPPFTPDAAAPRIPGGRGQPAGASAP
ncbi:hypothetical protein ACIRQY_32175 [Streptomyces sp. NPDC101490]|uniref:hypothetical protein n=1 Tax=Streptomyces sp. NPDC101490 TaxID=3366143 RepID=UPI0038019B51